MFISSSPRSAHITLLTRYSKNSVIIVRYYFKLSFIVAPSSKYTRTRSVPFILIHVAQGHAAHTARRSYVITVLKVALCKKLFASSGTVVYALLPVAAESRVRSEASSCGIFGLLYNRCTGPPITSFYHCHNRSSSTV